MSIRAQSVSAARPARPARPGLSTSLESHFYETREDQSRRALVDAVTRQPDTTMAELAEFVVQHPELSGMTLDELLERVRSNGARDQAFVAWLEGVEGPTRGFAKLPAGPSWPETHVSTEAARRIRGHAHAIADIVARVMRTAERLGLLVERTTIYADKILEGGGVIINFRMGAAGNRQALWDYIAEIEPGLPVEVWLTLA